MPRPRSWLVRWASCRFLSFSRSTIIGTTLNRSVARSFTIRARPVAVAAAAVLVGVCAVPPGLGCVLGATLAAGMIAGVTDFAFDVVQGEKEPTVEGALSEFNTGAIIGLVTAGIGEGVCFDINSVARSIGGRFAAAEADALATARKPPSKPSCNSFGPATRVLMAGGQTKPIRDIQVGDLVMAEDPQTGQVTEQPVTAVHINVDVDLIDALERRINSSVR